MPTLDLREPADPSRLNPLAHFMVLAAMLSPNNKLRRVKIMDSVRCDLGIKPTRGRPLNEIQSIIVQTFGNGRGSEAGFMMAELVRLHNQGFAPTLSKSIKLIQAELPKTLTGGRNESWQPHLFYEHLPRSPNKLKQIFVEFGPVAHLWAAKLHGAQTAAWHREQHHIEIHDGLPSSIENLPKFLNRAGAIWQLYDKISILKRADAPTFIGHPWKFIVPEHLKVPESLVPTQIFPDRLLLLTRPDRTIH